ncbi:MAG: hypothetical protein AMK75_07450 [Planctomycetes bacterium SM23_65]|nr:MAG: hypothetical protein AMK75_07450 [Planctomycetes bacterium SM23_65]
MKRLSWITVAVLLFAGWANAVPAFNLDGRMFVWTSNDHVDTNIWSNLSYVDWSDGTPGTQDNLAQLPNDTADVQHNYNNAHLMNNKNVLAITCDNNSYNTFSIWEINGQTGTTTRRWQGGSGYAGFGYTPCIALDPDNNNRAYTLSTGWNHYFLFEDTTSDGNYDTRTAVPKNSLHDYMRDAHMWNGRAYSIGKATRSGPLLGMSSMADSVNIAYDWYDDRDGWAEGDMYLWVGDPNANGHADVFFTLGLTENTTYRHSIFHYEDLDDNGYFEASEFVEQMVFGSGNRPRDVLGVTDLDKWMLVFVNSNRDLQYVNLLDNGSMDETGSLGKQLGPFNTGGLYIMMDQTQIPEPGTLLFVGTGVLAALGYLRRRRMR